jgi:hypothetical protein
MRSFGRFRAFLSKGGPRPFRQVFKRLPPLRSRSGLLDIFLRSRALFSCRHVSIPSEKEYRMP